MTKQEQAEYIEELQSELKAAEHKIRALNVELSLERLKYAKLKEQYVNGATNDKRRAGTTDSTFSLGRLDDDSVSGTGSDVSHTK